GCDPWPLRARISTPRELRVPPLLPCSSAAVSLVSAAAPRAEKLPVLVHLAAGPLPALREALGLPHLKLVAQPDKSDLIGNTGVGAKRFRKDDAPILVDAEDLHVAVERDRELVPLVRILREMGEKIIDFLRKSLAARIERRRIERGVAIDSASIAVALEHGAKGCRNGNSSFCVDFVRECRDKAIHPRFETSPDARTSTPTPPPLVTPCAQLPVEVRTHSARPRDWDVAVALGLGPSTRPAPRPPSHARCGRAFMGLHGIAWASTGG